MEEQLQQTTYEGNPTFMRALRRAMWKERTGLLHRIRILRAMQDPLIRQEVETAVTRMALDAGAIPPESTDVTAEGIYVGNWLTDLLEWILENAPAIIELVITIIGLFTEQGQ